MSLNFFSNYLLDTGQHCSTVLTYISLLMYLYIQDIFNLMENHKTAK